MLQQNNNQTKHQPDFTYQNPMPVDNVDTYEIANLQNLFFHGENGFRRESLFGGGYGGGRNNSLLSTLDSHHRFLEANNAAVQQANIN